MIEEASFNSTGDNVILTDDIMIDNIIKTRKEKGLPVPENPLAEFPICVCTDSNCNNDNNSAFSESKDYPCTIKYDHFHMKHGSIVPCKNDTGTTHMLSHRLKCAQCSNIFVYIPAESPLFRGVPKPGDVNIPVMCSYTCLNLYKEKNSVLYPWIGQKEQITHIKSYSKFN